MSNENKLNLLVAYPYLKKDTIDLIKNNQSDIRFLLDSGAFTAWKAGTPIALDDYCRFIEQLPFAPWRYFTLDVIGNAHASMKNYEIMLKRGFKPVPIFTRGEDPSVLEDYYKTSDVVGIGGLVGTRGNKGFVKGIMGKVKGRKVHWLGFVRHDYVNHYKPYMCDASSWSHASRNGDLKVYMGKGVIKSFRAKDFVLKPTKDILQLFKTYDIEPEELRSQKNWRAHNWLNKQAGRMWVRRSLESLPMLGTHLFLAAGSSGDINLLLDGYKKEVTQ